MKKPFFLLLAVLATASAFAQTSAGPLAATGLGLAAAGIISTIHKNNAAQNAYNEASARWYAQASVNPFGNNPMPALPHYSTSPLIYIGAITSLTCMIPLFNVANHAQKAINSYNRTN